MDIIEYDKMDSLENSHPWFVAKRNFLQYFLNEHLPIPARILDIGCGTGAVMRALIDRGYDVVGVDPCPDALNYCRRKGLDAIEASAEQTGQDDSSFDGVVCLDVLEHLANDKDGIEEIFRVLKPDGIAIIAVPAHQRLYSAHDEGLHHFRRYGRKQLCDLFGIGWEIKEITWLHASILLPLTAKRILLKIAGIGPSSSDVKSVSALASGLLSFIYRCELLCLEIFGGLPFGLSLLIVAKKKL